MLQYKLKRALATVLPLASFGLAAALLANLTQSPERCRREGRRGPERDVCDQTDSGRIQGAEANPGCQESAMDHDSLEILDHRGPLAGGSDQKADLHGHQYRQLPRQVSCSWSSPRCSRQRPARSSLNCATVSCRTCCRHARSEPAASTYASCRSW